MRRLRYLPTNKDGVGLIVMYVLERQSSSSDIELGHAVANRLMMAAWAELRKFLGMLGSCRHERPCLGEKVVEEWLFPPLKLLVISMAAKTTSITPLTEPHQSSGSHYSAWAVPAGSFVYLPPLIDELTITKQRVGRH
jgi:hypothetical protein